MGLSFACLMDWLGTLSMETFDRCLEGPAPMRGAAGGLGGPATPVFIISDIVEYFLLFLGLCYDMESQTWSKWGRVSF
jgi:hypothetical protein